ncbi:hypothetical protein IFM89_031683 [Coptis chinensis]|uniref:BHLH domain-containing protein n=1 Tax=Coptis chinensis TaxID=261450 RepID=A0A835HRB5_9MAGN|nr:hypothetical protein IFM89_031683 [Coptis chinensis]
MNYITHLHPLHQSDELLFQISSTNSCTKEKTVQQKMLLADASSGCCNPIKVVDKLQLHLRRKLCATTNTISEGSSDTNSNKKKRMKMHREVERQRRQEMATLYSKLRSLVPQEYLKGKRSISDHMNEAAHYIKHQQKKIKELVEKRDDLQRLSNSNNSNMKNHSSCSQNYVTVHACFSGVEIIVRNGPSDQVLPLSTVLGVLVEEGLSATSCTSTRVNENTFYAIQSEVSLCFLQKHYFFRF